MNARQATLSLVTTIILCVFTPLHAAPAPAFTPEQEGEPAEFGKNRTLTVQASRPRLTVAC